MTKIIRLTQTLAVEYQDLFDTSSIQSQHRAAIARLASHLAEQPPRYAVVAQLHSVAGDYGDLCAALQRPGQVAHLEHRRHAI